jgi:hypothetical protein
MEAFLAPDKTGYLEAVFYAVCPNERCRFEITKGSLGLHKFVKVLLRNEDKVENYIACVIFYSLYFPSLLYSCFE